METISRDDNLGLLIRKTKKWKRLKVKRISLWDGKFKYVTIK